MQNLKSRFLVCGAALSALLLGASCSDSKDDAEGGADASNALPACAGASENYQMVIRSEVEYYNGPNISVVLEGDEAVVLNPTEPNYGAGAWVFPDQSEWTVALCVNWDAENSDCDLDLVPLEGQLQIDKLEESDGTPTSFTGSFVSAIFVDDADSPTCQAKVDVTFGSDA